MKHRPRRDRIELLELFHQYLDCLPAWTLHWLALDDVRHRQHAEIECISLLELREQFCGEIYSQDDSFYDDLGRQRSYVRLLTDQFVSAVLRPSTFLRASDKSGAPQSHLAEHWATELFVSLGSLAVMSWIDGFVSVEHSQILLPLVHRWLAADALAKADFPDAELSVFLALVRDLPNVSGECLRLVANSLSEFFRSCPDFDAPPYTQDTLLRRLQALIKLQPGIGNNDWLTTAALVRCIRLLVERMHGLLFLADRMGPSLYPIMLEAIRRRDGGTIDACYHVLALEGLTLAENYDAKRVRDVLGATTEDLLAHATEALQGTFGQSDTQKHAIRRSLYLALQAYLHAQEGAASRDFQRPLLVPNPYISPFDALSRI
ncbi:hypothetical protein PsYK624_094610 [Phanerochaete sordida]|uniref:Uncharacterized protein n=1 Tax=Phanerochaete sordida TaxID=48140 RepID=A0A9P3GEH5_9APHY|nr:hypothetical protein PsYK624_094610 [Phanerochaete sordida]